MSKLTTLCYLEDSDRYLMLLRNKKKNDENHNKWIGVGGKFNENESPDDCLLREVKEETGLTLNEYRLRGIITFISDIYETEYMFLYTASGFTGDLVECDEGELSWIRKDDIMSLKLWEGDRIFLDLLIKDASFFTLKLEYQGDSLISYKLN